MMSHLLHVCIRIYLCTYIFKWFVKVYIQVLKYGVHDDVILYLNKLFITTRLFGSLHNQVWDFLLNQTYMTHTIFYL